MSTSPSTATAPGWDYRNRVDLAICIYYGLVAPVALFLAIRLGFKKSQGWLYLLIFSTVRITGAAMQLSTMNDAHPSTSTLTTVGILQSVGLSPLFFVSLGLLDRVNSSMTGSPKQGMGRMISRGTHIAILVGLILAVIGGLQAGKDLQHHGTYTTKGISKVGVILFVLGFLGILAFIGLLSLGFSSIPGSEKRFVLAVAASAPLLFVRLIYSILSTFHGGKFSPISGNVTILICLAYIEEMTVVLIYLGVGLTAQKPKYDAVQTGDSDQEMGFLRSQEGSAHSSKQDPFR